MQISPLESLTSTVFVVDDDPNVLQGVSRLLRASGYEVRGFSSPVPLLEEDERAEADCIILDVSMPGLNGLEFQTAMAASGRQSAIVFITGNGDIPTSVQAMKAGAVDFLVKPFDESALLEAVRTATEKDRAMRKALAQRQEVRSKLSALTRREYEVMQGVIAGHLNKRIAADLGIAEKTVKVHRQRVMEKMAAHSVADLVRCAQRAELEPA